MATQTGKRLTDSKLRNIAPKSKPLTSSAVAGLVFYPSSSTKGAGRGFSVITITLLKNVQK